jgi:tRNA (guanine-N7-)-methyltransferase
MACLPFMSASAIPDLRPWFLTLDDLPPPPIDFRALFGNDHPVELEVGSGRGLFLVTAGASRPDTNFLGVEYDFKEGRRAARRFQKREFPNVRLLGADANIVLPKYLSDRSLAGVHVYFPDPWWKRRHRRRRIWNPGFVDQIARILRPGGLLHAWTDVEEYFEVIRRLLTPRPEYRMLPEPEERAAQHDMDYHTSFERKKRKLGLAIYRSCWVRTDAAIVPMAVAETPVTQESFRR